MSPNLPLFILVGLLIAHRIQQCQTQGDVFMGTPLADMSSIKREIAKFESQLAQGENGTRKSNTPANVHDQLHADQTVTSMGETDRHAHHVHAVNVPIADGKLTDIHGNHPPHSGGLHVDLPKEHGNDNPFPVLHDGAAPINTNNLPPVDGIHNKPTNDPPSMFGPPTLEDLMGTSKDIFSTPQIQSAADATLAHVSNHGDLLNTHGTSQHVPVMHQQPNPMPDSDLTSLHLSVDPSGVQNNIINAPGIQRQSGNGLNNGHGHQGVHVDLPGRHENNLPFPVVHRPGSNDVHVDPPGFHNNMMNVPVIHRPSGKGPGSDHGNHGVHVDPPGFHNNNMNVPVIHRLSGKGPVGVNDHGGVHVDPPGVHNNRMNIPVIHRPSRTGPIGGNEHDGVHVDPPGVHNNRMSIPVIHRPSGTGPHGSHGQHGVHVDLPGMHQNNLPFPVVHRPGSNDVHVDHPGFHNNNMDIAVIHRPSGKELNDGTGHHGVHVDPPGFHNNNMNVPVIHRPSRNGPPVGDGPHGVHIDQPSMHENNLPFPVVHRPGRNDVHVDPPGVHNNNINIPVIHRPNGKGLNDGHGHHGVHVDMPGVHNNNMNVPVIHRPSGKGPIDGHGHGGAHVDLAGMHGNNVPVPIGHRPSGSISPIHPVNSHIVNHHNIPASAISRPAGIGPPLIIGGPGNAGIHSVPGNLLPIVHQPTDIGLPVEIGTEGIHGKSSIGHVNQLGHPIGEPHVHPPDDKILLKEKRRQQRKRLRRLERRKNRGGRRKGSLLSDVLDTSVAVSKRKDHIKDIIHDKPNLAPKKANQGVIVVRRQPVGATILSSILSSLVPTRLVGPRPITVRLGPRFPPPRPQQNPPRAVASSLVGMLMDRIVAG